MDAQEFPPRVQEYRPGLFQKPKWLLWKPGWISPLEQVIQTSQRIALSVVPKFAKSGSSGPVETVRGGTGIGGTEAVLAEAARLALVRLG